MHFDTQSIRPDFIAALHDYFYLLEKNYPQKAVLKLVGDRYKLKGIERSMLFRGVFKPDASALRCSKKCSMITEKDITIDTYNVCITIGSYLNGNVLFVGTDGFLRDAAEVHGKVFRTSLMEKSVNLLLHYVKYQTVNSVVFFIDRPVSHSGKLKKFLEQKMNEYELNGQVKLYQSPDFHLKKVVHGIVASSDSVVINKAQVPVFDLAFAVLSHHFHPKFVILKNLINL